MLLKSACEPIIGVCSNGVTYRTHERWVELHKERLGQFTVIFGNDRGTIERWTHFNEGDAILEFERVKANCGMDEDAPKQIKQLIKEKVVFT